MFHLDRVSSETVVGNGLVPTGAVPIRLDHVGGVLFGAAEEDDQIRAASHTPRKPGVDVHEKRPTSTNAERKGLTGKLLHHEQGEPEAHGLAEGWATAS
jgi:hypothetical protein